MYQYASGNWSQLGTDRDGVATYDYSGNTVSLIDNGSIVAIGARYHDIPAGSNTGHVRMYD